MSTAELKIDLINQISSITDEVKLKELLHLLNFQNDESVYVTTQEDKDVIAEAQTQIRNGEIISNSDVQKEISQWLNI